MKYRVAGPTTVDAGYLEAGVPREMSREQLASVLDYWCVCPAMRGAFRVRSATALRPAVGVQEGHEAQRQLHPDRQVLRRLLVCYGGAAEVTGNRKNVDAMLTFAAERAPWALVGYSDDLAKLFKQKTQELCAAIEQRKREPAKPAPR